MSSSTGPLVLHICCAPDEAWAVHVLRETRQLHCFFSNPNIQPRDEYLLRLEEARKAAQHFDVAFSDDPYDPDAWESVIAGKDHTGEGGERCYHCFLIRLRRTARFCRDRGIAAFSSVMSISPHKHFPTLCKAGQEAAREFGVDFEPIDFKKKDGFAQSVKLSRELGLYRQDYCGCRLSKEETAGRRRKMANIEYRISNIQHRSSERSEGEEKGELGRRMSP